MNKVNPLIKRPNARNLLFLNAMYKFFIIDYDLKYNTLKNRGWLSFCRVWDGRKINQKRAYGY